MGVVIPLRRERSTKGTVHIRRLAEGGYEIAHESSSGDSWGFFQTFKCPIRAMVAACRLNLNQLEGRAELAFSDDVIGDLEAGRDRREVRHG